MYNLVSVNNVILSHFRNYTSASVNLGKYNVVFGDNGSGKTNFLEALSLFSPGKGLRNSNFEELLPFSNANLHCKAELSSILGNNNLTLKRTTCPIKGIAKKVILLDESPIRKAQDLPKFIQPIWFTPKMDLIFLEDSTSQRSFFDRLIFNLDPSHLSRINSYGKALKERNALIKNKSHNWSWYSSLEQIMAEQATAIISSRIDFIEKLNKIISKSEFNFYNKLTIENLGIVEDNLKNCAMSAKECENFIQQSLADSRQKDLISGATSLGVHRSVFKVVNLKNNLVARLCSTGEQKRLVITIIMAFVQLVMVESKQSPLLLLDEFLVHLDKNIKNVILEYLISLPLQFIITSTDLEDFTHHNKVLNKIKVQNNQLYLAN